MGILINNQLYRCCISFLYILPHQTVVVHQKVIDIHNHDAVVVLIGRCGCAHNHELAEPIVDFLERFELLIHLIQ